MRRLKPLCQNEDGAVALVVAVLFGSLVLLGCAALTIDVGSISVERRLLQNGADAAAGSAARECATTTMCPDVTSASDPKMARLKGLANLNAGPDGATSVTRVDGNFAVCGAGKPELKSCAPVSGNPLRNCPSGGPTPAQYVRVYTQTSFAGGNTILPSGFAQALTGSSAGTTNQACAAYAWGVPSAFSVVSPVAISLCDYQSMMAAGGYADPPPYTSPIPPSVVAHEVALVVNDPSQTADTNNCAHWAGHVLPGGFAYLNPDTGCQPTVSAGDWVQGKPGNSVPSSCKSSLDPIFAAPVNNRPVLLAPVFDCVSDHTKVCPKATTGSDTWYHVKGLAAFYITGSNLPSYNYPPLQASTACPSGAKCLYGWFTEATLRDSSGDIGPGTGFGVNIIKAVG